MGTQCSTWKMEMGICTLKWVCTSFSLVIPIGKSNRSFPHIHEKWDDARLKKEKSHVMVTLKGRFQGENKDQCHMLLSVGITYSGIKERGWSYLDGEW